MKKFLSCVVTFLVVAGVLPTGAFAEAGVEDLLFMELPTVVTASKKAESINVAPSIMYVVTAEDIKRSGARTLGEALKRVPGFRTTVREVTLLGSRGFTSDQNDKYVWLYDGMPIQNIMQDGPWGILDVPNMDMVERIEIVKGPGSTLYGSNASLGIINVITKSGEKVDGLRPSVSYSTRDNQIVSNMLYGNKTDNGEYMMSLTYTKSDGFGDSGGGYNNVYQWWDGNKNLSYDNYNLSGDQGRNGNLLTTKPSWDMYAKLKSGDISFRTKASYTRMNYLWGDNLDGMRCDTIFKHLVSEVEKENKISDDTTLSIKANFHTLSYDRGVLVQAIDPLAVTNMETKTEMGLEVESILKTVLAEKHSIVAGIKANTVQFGPSQRQEFMVGTGTSTLNGGLPPADIYGYGYAIVTNANEDSVSGVYVEDSFKATDKLTLVAGAGYEYDNFVEVGGKFMPRGAVIYEFSKEWSAKGCWNTGYERPPVDKKFHKVFGHVEESEDIEEADIQLSYTGRNTRASITGYNFYMSNYFTWVDIRDTVTNVVTATGHVNQGTAKSDGFEFDIRHNLTSSLALFANLTYANTKINNVSPNGDPTEFYNVGANYYVTKDISLDVNANGFFDMPNGRGGLWYGDGLQLVDATVVYDNVFGKPLCLTGFVRNAFDVKSPISMTGWPGYTYAEAASYGIKAAYKF
jgi:outer membrane receptor protein involved in Fe transport